MSASDVEAQNRALRDSIYRNDGSRTFESLYAEALYAIYLRLGDILLELENR